MQGECRALVLSGRFNSRDLGLHAPRAPKPRLEGSFMSEGSSWPDTLLGGLPRAGSMDDSLNLLYQFKGHRFGCVHVLRVCGA